VVETSVIQATRTAPLYLICLHIPSHPRHQPITRIEHLNLPTVRVHNTTHTDGFRIHQDRQG
jgi:hypothetical protein